MAKKPEIVLGVTGSIAAYKAAELVRLLRKRDWSVSVVMTSAATRFVSALTFRTLSQQPVSVAMFDDDTDWKPDHISLADRADVMVIAPCTANVLAKLAHGLADDLLTCTALACSAPLLLAPAMNEKMWQNPATVANVDLVKARGLGVLGVGEGDLACGYRGSGRMLEPETIVQAIENHLDPEND
jgi:phosphopantothenoylcysteine synthetase/decarboxylase